MGDNLKKIHDSEFEKEVIRLMEDDIRLLATKQADFIFSNCPTCNFEKLSIHYNVFGLNYYRCNNCGTTFLNPCPKENSIVEYLNNSKGLTYWRENMPEHVVKSRKEKLYKDRIDFIAKQIDFYSVEMSKFLDIGGGRGELIEELIASRIKFNEYIIIEPQPLDISLPKVKIIPKTLEKIDEKIEANLAVAFEVLEHIIDPHFFLKNINKLLATDGILILSTPNIDGFEISTLKEQSTSCWFDHIRLYNPKSLRYLLEENGFEVLLIETPGELDVEIIKRVYDNEKLNFSSNPALQFLMEDGRVFHKEFQNFLIKNNLSSHMECIARKK